MRKRNKYTPEGNGTGEKEYRKDTRDDERTSQSRMLESHIRNLQNLLARTRKEAVQVSNDSETMGRGKI